MPRVPPKITRMVGEAARKYGRSTLRGAERKAFPGIYEDPRVIRQQAEQMVAPESPYLSEIFGVTREDLRAIANSRAGNREAVIPNAPPNPRGAESAQAVMAPANTRRLVDTLTELRASPAVRSMEGWYVMDPAYQLLLEQVGGDAARAKQLYQRVNTVTGMLSPGSEVLTELNRGLAANRLINEGRLEDFVQYGGKMGRGPQDMSHVMGHAYHQTAHSKPLKAYLAAGEPDPFSLPMASPKVPLYIQASGVPETGFQTNRFIGDAHWSRGVGLADVRKAQEYGGSVSVPEAVTLGPWWEREVARKVGLQPVPAQALLWGGLAKQTGVTSPIGAPKLELLAQYVGSELAPRLRLPPREAMKRALAGEAGYATPAAMGAAGAAGAGGMLMADDLDALINDILNRE